MLAIYKQWITDNAQWLTALFIIIAALAVSLPGAFDTGPVWSDGNRYTFNGILIHDMIRDGGFISPYSYAVDFYSRYPAVNLPYGPPFFAAIFALAFAVFGIAFSVARCVVSIYTVCAALMCWFLVWRLNKRHLQAILAVSALLFIPLTGVYARDITPEVPVAFFSFLAIYCFYNFVEDGKRYYCIFTALALGLGYLTKPYIVPLGFAFAAYICVFRKWHIFRKRETYLAAFVFLILVLPQTILAYKLAFNELGSNLPHISFNMIAGYTKLSFTLLPFFTAVSIAGFAVAIYKKDRLPLLSMLWLICSYIFYTFYLTAGYADSKYYYSLFLSMIIPFAVGALWTINFLEKWRLNNVAVICLFFWFAYSAFSTPVYRVQGHEVAGNYVAKNPYGKSVLYYGSYDGSFMMGLRRHIQKGGPYVLRGDRQLAVRVSYGDAAQHVIVKSEQDIIDIFKKYHTGYVVVESYFPWVQKYPEYLLLLETVKNEKLFKEVKRVPIKSNYTHLGPELIIYRTQFDFMLQNGQTLTIPVPTLRRTLETPLR